MRQLRLSESFCKMLEKTGRDHSTNQNCSGRRTDATRSVNLLDGESSESYGKESDLLVQEKDINVLQKRDPAWAYNMCAGEVIGENTKGHRIWFLNHGDATIRTKYQIRTRDTFGPNTNSAQNFNYL